MRRLLFIFLLSTPVICRAATIYQCRAYAGGEFWASAHCHQHKALLLRIANVPDGLSFQDQVNIAAQQAAAGNAVLQNAAPQVQKHIRPSGTTADNSECAVLARQAKRIDDVASKPQTAYQQGALAEEKRGVRSRQALLRCG